MATTHPPCVGANSWKWDLDHAEHGMLVGPCLPCSEAVTGCLQCPLLAACQEHRSAGMIRGGIAYIGDTPNSNGVRKARLCRRCENPIDGPNQKAYCTLSCKKDTVWTYSMALAQADHHRFRRRSTEAT